MKQRELRHGKGENLKEKRTNKKDKWEMERRGNREKIGKKGVRLRIGESQIREKYYFRTEREEKIQNHEDQLFRKLP
jgi:hypothetical protein